MATQTSGGYEWPQTSRSRAQSDAASPVYPDRPIRPLPKRPLHARLSPEQVKTIKYPPKPANVGSVFAHPSIGHERSVQSSTAPAASSQRAEGAHICHCGAEHAEELESEEEEAVSASMTSPGFFEMTRNLINKSTGFFAKSPPPVSVSSSPDGYDSLENTNNKKKRKIPVSVNGSSHHVSLSSEMANMGISSRGVDTMAGEHGGGQYYTSGSSAMGASGSGTGLSGAGRGRYGRTMPRGTVERRPLTTTTNGANSNATGQQPDQGIISAAIANAAQQGPVNMQKGNENISLLHQESSKQAPQSSQFTFTCDSDPASEDGHGRAKNPFSSASLPNLHTNPQDVHHQRDVAARGVAGRYDGVPPLPPGNPQPSSAQAQPPPATPQQQSQARPRRRRTLTEEYENAARDRSERQRLQNASSTPKSEDIWICQFCEYEAIYGHMPRAMIRRYEEKDLRARKLEAEKRRLLEKAKMKNRNQKKKKQTKADKSHQHNSAAAPNATGQQYAQGQPQAGGNGEYDYHPDDPAYDQLDGAVDDFYDEEYDDENYESSPPLDGSFVPSPTDHHGLNGSTAGVGGGARPGVKVS